MRRRIGTLAIVLLGAFAFAAIAGILPSGMPSLAGLASVEASNEELKAQSNKAVVNQQAAISDAIAVHGADKWHEAGFTGTGVKIGVIDRGFAGIQEHMGTELPEPVGVRCYYYVQVATIEDNFTEDLADCENAELGVESVGAAVLEAAFDIAPDAEYYVAAVSRDDFYHFDLIRIVEWMHGEGVDFILFTHDGGWSGPGDGTSIYPTSELRTLDNAVNLGMTWISPTNDRAQATWSGFFNDSDGDGIHEFTDDGVECNGVTLTEPNNLYQAQIRWNDPWGASNHDLEAALVDDTGHVVATSRKAEFGRTDPNELVEFTSPDPEVSYCIEISLAVPTTDRIIIGLQSYHGHALDHPSIYGSVTSPAESVNPGMLAVGAAAWDNTMEIRPFSGRGPMVNAHTKPDIVGGDGAHSAVLGESWASTAQSAAHVAGMAALVKQRYPDYTPAMIADYLRDNAESRAAELGDFSQSPDNNNTWGHGFAMLPDDVEGVSPPSIVDPLEATKAYVDEAIRRYREDPEAAKVYYRTRESFVNDPPGLYLLLLDGDTIVVNGVFPGSQASSISWRSDPLGVRFGEKFLEVDENGSVVEYLIPVRSQGYTFRKKTAWAIKADGLIFSAGWLDLETDVESSFTEPQRAIGEVIEARARIQAETAQPALQHYQSAESIHGEFYTWIAFPRGPIAAYAPNRELEGTTVVNAFPDVGQQIMAVNSLEGEWIPHSWPNPATGQVEMKYSYVTRFFNFYIVSGYYGDEPPPGVVDPCFTTVDGSGIYSGKWDESCVSGRPAERGSGDRYARFYTFTLPREGSVAVTLTSDDADAYLYLIKGEGKSGELVASNDDIEAGNTNSEISAVQLDAGTYTIEATTYDAEATGDFTLEVEIEVTDVPPVPAPIRKYLAFSNGMNHVCAIAEDGSIDCWGNDDFGQVSERPMTGSFKQYAQIGSGANHTCALRDDRALICWGDIDLP